MHEEAGNVAKETKMLEIGAEMKLCAPRTEAVRKTTDRAENRVFWRRRRAQSEERRKGWLDVGRRTLFFGCLVTGHPSDVDLDFGADEARDGGWGQPVCRRMRQDLPTVLTFGLDQTLKFLQRRIRPIF